MSRAAEDTAAPVIGEGAQVGDGVRFGSFVVVHPGTVGSAYLANGFIGAMNTKFGSGIALFSEHEIYQAGVSFPELLSRLAARLATIVQH